MRPSQCTPRTGLGERHRAQPGTREAEAEMATSLRLAGLRRDRQPPEPEDVPLSPLRHARGSVPKLKTFETPTADRLLPEVCTSKSRARSNRSVGGHFAEKECT